MSNVSLCSDSTTTKKSVGSRKMGNLTYRRAKLMWQVKHLNGLTLVSSHDL
jgi:hypothetical protein